MTAKLQNSYTHLLQP